ncbi:hypothetical protein EMIHUDRAFT_447072, partial [Emiliania huxleyi CCMP1516]|uniref:Uncharacterized protein n=2 Tax=Emiliania huxleyi TaxID=2903 RepID=A0A0D3KF79_EMIH1
PRRPLVAAPLRAGGSAGTRGARHGGGVGRPHRRPRRVCRRRLLAAQRGRLAARARAAAQSLRPAGAACVAAGKVRRRAVASVGPRGEAWRQRPFPGRTPPPAKGPVRRRSRARAAAGRAPARAALAGHPAQAWGPLPIAAALRVRAGQPGRARRLPCGGDFGNGAGGGAPRVPARVGQLTVLQGEIRVCRGERKKE